MPTRTNSKTITFRHPFRLLGIDDLQPAGGYQVETEEEQIPNLSFPAYRRLSTLIHLAGTPQSQEMARIVDIDPVELAALLARDADVPDTIPSVGGDIEGT